MSRAHAHTACLYTICLFVCIQQKLNYCYPFADKNSCAKGPEESCCVRFIDAVLICICVYEKEVKKINGMPATVWERGRELSLKSRTLRISEQLGFGPRFDYCNVRKRGLCSIIFASEPPLR